MHRERSGRTLPEIWKRLERTIELLELARNLAINEFVDQGS
jgi:hypothetical protein